MHASSRSLKLRAFVVRARDDKRASILLPMGGVAKRTPPYAEFEQLTYRVYWTRRLRKGGNMKKINSLLTSAFTLVVLGGLLSACLKDGKSVEKSFDLKCSTEGSTSPDSCKADIRFFVSPEKTGESDPVLSRTFEDFFGKFEIAQILMIPYFGDEDFLGLIDGEAKKLHTVSGEDPAVQESVELTGIAPQIFVSGVSTIHCRAENVTVKKGNTVDHITSYKATAICEETHGRFAVGFDIQHDDRRAKEVKYKVYFGELIEDQNPKGTEKINKAPGHHGTFKILSQSVDWMTMSIAE